MSLLVINPSINVSPYCYSIFRIEPYLTCEHRCVYCFGRWYRVGDSQENKPMLRSVMMFKIVAKRVRARGLKMIPFRLSTLVDPFQPIERSLRLSRYVMKISLKLDVPLIVNTKATLLMDEEYLSVLRGLHDKELVLVQISLSTINDKIAKILEPNAPSPHERLKMAERLSAEGVPVVIRLQPLIPGITDVEIEEIVREARGAGAKQIIVEALRDEIDNLKIFRDVAYDKRIYDSQDEWTTYSPSVQLPLRVVKPSVSWRLRVFTKLRELCDKHGLELSTCKEGFYYLHTARNCCGMHHIGQDRYVLRPTLQEAWSYYLKHGRMPSFDELIGSLDGSKYVCGEHVKAYPRDLRKGLRQHEDVLRQVLSDSRTLSRLVHIR